MADVQQIIDKNKESLIIPDGIVVISKDKQIIVFNEAGFFVLAVPEDRSSACFPGLPADQFYLPL